jgi:hypothetical protein
MNERVEDEIYTLDVAHRKIKTMTAKATRTLTTSPIDSLVVLDDKSERESRLVRWWLLIYSLGAVAHLSCDFQFFKLTLCRSIYIVASQINVAWACTQNF